MSFTVSMVINGDASGARRAMDSAQAGVSGLQGSLRDLVAAQGRTATASTALGAATARLATSQRSTASSTAMLASGIGEAGAAAARGRVQIAGLPPALRNTSAATGSATAQLRSFRDQMLANARALAQSSGAIGGKTAALIGLRGAAAAAGAAVGTLALGAGIGIRRFADYERQILTVEQVIRATGGAAGRTTSDIDRMSVAIARGTLASARDVRAAAGQLLTFRSIAGETFDRTLNLAQDLSAVGFGSIEQSAMQLAKALEDPEQGLAALRRVGISFSATQIEMIRNFAETGRVAEAQNAILAQVEKQVGGAGAAAGGGLAGAFDAAGGATAQFFEIVGRGFAGLIKLEELLNGVARGLDRLNDRMTLDSDTQFLDQLRAERDNLVRLLNADDQRSGWNPLTWGRDQEAGRQQVLSEINRLNDEILAIQRRHAREREEIDRQSAAAREQAERERAEAVISALEAEIDAIGRTAVETETLSALRRAGVTAEQELGQAIIETVQRKHELTEATQAAEAAAAAERQEKERSAARTRDLIDGLRQELAVMRESDPVMRAMLGHRSALTNATWMQRAAVLALTTAIEEEARAQAVGSEIERLQFQTRIAGLSELERRQAEAARRLEVDPDSDEGRALAEAIRLNYQAEQARRSRTGAQRAGVRATRAERDAAAELIAQLTLERDILRESDPVQQELIRHRETLAKATDAQRDAIEALIRELQKEAEELSELDKAWADFSKTAYDALEDLIINGAKLEDVMLNVARAIQRAALEAALLGTGPLAGLFGGGGGGGLLGALGGLIGLSPVKKRDGGMIHGAGGPRDDRVPLAAKPGDFIVNAAATARNRAVLEAIRAGRSGGDAIPVLASAGEFRVSAEQAIPNLGLLEAINAGVDVQKVARPQRFAAGGMVSRPRNIVARSADPGRGGAASGGGAVVNHFHIQTPDAKSFTTSRASVTRTARGLAERAARYS